MATAPSPPPTVPSPLTTVPSIHSETESILQGEGGTHKDAHEIQEIHEDTAIMLEPHKEKILPMLHHHSFTDLIRDACEHPSHIFEIMKSDRVVHLKREIHKTLEEPLHSKLVLLSSSFSIISISSF